MPEYLSPGVYVEEIDAGPKPIEGVSTSTAGAVGVTEKGPSEGRPILITSFAQFQRLFGGVLPDPKKALQDAWQKGAEARGIFWRFPLSVKGFFDNGGQRIFIKRVVASGATTAFAQLARGLYLDLRKTAKKGAKVLELNRTAQLTGIEQGTTVRLERTNGEGAAQGPFTVEAYDTAAGTVTLSTALTEEASPGAWVLSVQAAGATDAFIDKPSIKFSAAAKGEWGNKLRVRVQPMVTTTLTLLPAPDGAKPEVIFISDTSPLYEGALLELDNGKRKHVTSVVSIAGNVVTVDKAPPANTFSASHAARLIEARCEVLSPSDTGQLEVAETFENLRLKEDGSPGYLVTRVTEDSDLVSVTADPGWAAEQPSLETFPAARHGAQAPLINGDDKLDSLTTDDFVGNDLGPGKRSGIAALEDIDEISICMVPGIWAQDVRSALITHCESLRDRFAIVDPQPAELLDVAVRTDPETIKGPVDTKYAAVYYPWLIGRDFAARRDVLIPPSGHMAGVYARTDTERGVHKAPANEVVRGISKFELEITKREQDMLNPKGVNALRQFPGRGMRVWGARTLSSDGSWKYINVRRLFLFVEESIDEGTQWVVFEPNDDKLWARVRLTITQFLERIWREGMLMGLTRDEAFFVKCDRTTMTQDDIDNGRLICLIGIAPVKPAEFVIFRIQQKTLEQKG